MHAATYYHFVAAEDSSAQRFEDVSTAWVDVILVSNSTWVSDDRPCITYGMRGVVHCSLEVCFPLTISRNTLTISLKISSNLPDLHSGVDGGAVSEPMFDMVKLLACLSEGQHVLIPGFCTPMSSSVEYSALTLLR